MRAYVGAVCAIWLLGCSTDTFVGEDASTDAALDGSADGSSDGAPPIDGGVADAFCPPNADLACGAKGCATVGSCCVTPDAAACAATCSGVELSCQSQSECAPVGLVCCLGNVGTIGGCPVAVGGNGLASKCETSCGANAAKICTIGQTNECGNGGTCIPVVFDVNTSVKIGLCSK